MREEVTAGGNLCSFGQRRSEGTLSQFKSRFQLGCLGLPHTWDRTKFFNSTLREASDTSEPIQNIHPNLHS
jgi:hypothetical protein